jgi:hypothetical protein
MLEEFFEALTSTYYITEVLPFHLALIVGLVAACAYISWEERK